LPASDISLVLLSTAYSQDTSTSRTFRTLFTSNIHASKYLPPSTELQYNFVYKTINNAPLKQISKIIVPTQASNTLEILARDPLDGVFLTRNTVKVDVYITNANTQEVISNVITGTANLPNTIPDTEVAPNTSWITGIIKSGFGFNNGVLSGVVGGRKTSLFHEDYLNRQFVIYVQLKTSTGGNYSIEGFEGKYFGSNNEITQYISYNLTGYNSITLQVYIWEKGSNVPYSDVTSYTFTNNITTLADDYPALPVATIPQTPVLTVQSIDNLNKILSWTGNVTDQINIERATSVLDYSSIFGDLQDNDNQINIVLPDVTETYYYRVRTKNSVGYSNYSNVITINVTGSAPPPPTGTIPAAPNITSSTQSADLGLISWNPVATATSYNLENITPLNSTWMSFGDFTANMIDGKLGIQVNLVSGNGVYQYRLRAKNSYGYSSYSNITILTKEIIIPPPTPATQQVIQISTPNNSNSIRGVFNSTSLNKWIYDNENSLLCNYPEFAGLNVPCSLSYYIVPDVFVSEADNFQSVIEQIRLRYSGNQPPAPTPTDNKNLLSLVKHLFVMGTGIGLLVSKK